MTIALSENAFTFHLKMKLFGSVWRMNDGELINSAANVLKFVCQPIEHFGSGENLNQFMSANYFTILPQD